MRPPRHSLTKEFPRRISAYIHTNLPSCLPMSIQIHGSALRNLDSFIVDLLLYVYIDQSTWLSLPTCVVYVCIYMHTYPPMYRFIETYSVEVVGYIHTPLVFC